MDVRKRNTRHEILPRSSARRMGSGSAEPIIRDGKSLFVAWYNFGRKHESLKGSTPAMASQLTDHVWTIKELIERAGVKFILAIIVFGLSIPIGFLAAANIYYIFKTRGSSQLPPPEMGHYVMTGSLIFLAILLFTAGVSLASTKKKS
jgi:hypothetical protein